MPKFDWTQVVGYREEMTADEKLALLEADDAIPEAPPTVSKAVFDKTASELSEVKKQLRARQSEEEIRAAETAAQQAKLEEELTTLRREKTLSSHKASFLARGYDEALAAKAAEALADGKTDDLFAVMQQYQACAEKEMRAKILNDTQVPPPSAESSNPGDAALRRALGLRVAP